MNKFELAIISFIISLNWKDNFSFLYNIVSVMPSIRNCYFNRNKIYLNGLNSSWKILEHHWILACIPIINNFPF